MKIDKSKITILIVDDTPENVTVLGEYLNEYKIKVALDGKKALSILESGTIPSIILLDIMMPEMDGYEVCTRIKMNPLTKDIPIVFITAMTELKDKIKGFQLGAVDYITKPFQLEEVKSRIDTHVYLSFLRMQLQNTTNILEQMVEERTEELIIERNKAEEASKLKSHFLALMSHELRTPMAGILGFSEALADEIENPVHQDFARSIHDAGMRLKETLESILKFSKLESRSQITRPEVFNLSDRIKDLSINHRLNASVKGLNFFIKDELKCPNVFLDKTMFDIILNNLIGNAIKYTETGSVTVELYEEKDELSTCHCIKVMDTGIGIAKDKHEIIFDEFRQVDEGMKRNFEGVGLGLSLVRKYILLLNGKLELDSDLGKGSSFTIKFQSDIERVELSPQKISEEINIKSPKIISGVKPKVLLVEDDFTNVMVAKLFLQDLVDLSIANDGATAIKMAHDEDFLAILMDINLGSGLSGIEVTKIIKGFDKYKDVPIIAFTAFAMDGDEKNFIEEGCTHYLPKPCSKKELTSLIENLLLN